MKKSKHTGANASDEHFCSLCQTSWSVGHSFGNCIANVRARAWREAALIVASAPQVREDSAGNSLVLKGPIVDRLRFYAEEIERAARK